MELVLELELVVRVGRRRVELVVRWLRARLRDLAAVHLRRLGREQETGQEWHQLPRSL